MTNSSSHPDSISVPKGALVSMTSSDWESASNSVDEEDFEYLNDESTRRALDTRWSDLSSSSDALPSVTRRRENADELDEPETPKASNSSTKLGRRLSKLTNSPANSPRSSRKLPRQTKSPGTSPRSMVAEFLYTASANRLNSAPLTDDEDDDLSLDDTIYTVEDEIEFMRVVMETTAI